MNKSETRSKTIVRTKKTIAAGITPNRLFCFLCRIWLTGVTHLTQNSGAHAAVELWVGMGWDGMGWEEGRKGRKEGCMTTLFITLVGPDSNFFFPINRIGRHKFFGGSDTAV